LFSEKNIAENLNIVELWKKQFWEKNKILLTDIIDENGNYLTVILSGQEYTTEWKAENNYIRSIYHQNNPSCIIKWINSDLTLYRNEEKNEPFLT
jgi:hypothetical protein